GLDVVCGPDRRVPAAPAVNGLRGGLIAPTRAGVDTLDLANVVVGVGYPGTPLRVTTSPPPACKGDQGVSDVDSVGNEGRPVLTLDQAVAGVCVLNRLAILPVRLLVAEVPDQAGPVVI